MRDQKLHAVVARSRFGSEKAKNRLVSEHYWSCAPQKVQVAAARSTFQSENSKCTTCSHQFSKKCVGRCGAKHISKSKCQKHLVLRALVGVEFLKKCTRLWGKARSQVKMAKTAHVRTSFGSCMVEKVRAVGAKHISKSKVLKAGSLGLVLEVCMWFRVAGAMDSAPCQKWAKTWRLHSSGKTIAGVGRSKGICKDEFRAARAIRETSSPEMRSAHRFLFRFPKMILCDRCKVQHFVAGAVLWTDGVQESQNMMAWGHQLCSPLSTDK